MLGIPEAQVSQRFKDLMFVGLARVSEPKDSLTMPDPDRVRKFAGWMRQKAPDQEAVSFDAVTVDDTTAAYFEKIYKLLTRRKQ